MLTNLHDAFRGQSRSPNIVPFHMLSTVSLYAIEALSSRRAFFPIFDFKNVVTLKYGSGHSRSLKVIPFDRLHLILLVFYRNFRRYSTSKMPWPWKLGWDPSRSLEISPCDSAYDSYWRSIVTMALSRVVSEIFSVEKCRDLLKGHSRSLKVVPFDRLYMVSY